MPGWASPARPAVYKPPAGAQVASPQSPILRRSRSRLSELHHQTRGADKSPLLIARLLLLSTNGLLLLTRLSTFARPATYKYSEYRNPSVTADFGRNSGGVEQ